MSSRASASDPSPRLTTRQASAIIGYGPTCLLRRFVREGLLPWPRQSDMTWSTDDVMSLKAWMDCRRETGSECPEMRPHHQTY